MRRQKKRNERKPRYYKGRNLRKERQKSQLPKRIFLLLLLPISYGITLLCKNNPKIAEEVFARGFYRFISIGLSSLTSIIPVSMTEIIYVVVPVVALIVLIRFGVRVVRHSGERARVVGHFLLNLGCVFSVMLFLFTILCGVNYDRYSFTYYSGLKIQGHDVDDLYELYGYLVTQANELREQVPKVDENGVFQLTTSVKETARNARDAMSELSKEYEVLGGWNAVPKPVLLSKYMSYTEITGMFFPYTMECNVNVDIPQYSILATMCHELTHLRGFMREDEANFIAYLACTQSENVELRYSGTMLGLIHVGNALYRQDKERFSQLRDTYSDGVDADIKANHEYWKKFENKTVSKISDQVNDTYLKANHQKDGVLSYGRMVDLLLAWYEKYE